MKTPIAFLAMWLTLAAISVQAVEQHGWISMFNSKDLIGWKSNEEKPGVFTVNNGELKVSGGRAHLFFVGADGNAKFKNFEFKAKVKTTPGANSGIYFHTEFQKKGWPSKGFEAQVNTTSKDRKKTGGLYAVQDVIDHAPSKDNEWFDYHIKVDGRHVVIQINGKITADWTQPLDWDPATALKDMPGRKLGEGTIALQGHDPKSTVYYKDLYIRPLP
jgi:hypothetical protein